MTAPLHAVVTGGGSGIGAAVAVSLLKEGHQVTLMGRNLQRLQAQQQRLGDVAVQVCDVGDEASVSAAFAAIAPVDLLINNAGQVETAPLAKTSLEAWQRMLNVNLTGTFLCSRAVIPAMRERGFGRIVNVASTAGLKGYAYVAAYCAAKHGVVGMTRALALELAKSGITVNAVCPGYTETEIVATAIETIQAKTGRTADEALAELAKANPQGRLIAPEEVAASVLWLTRPEAGGVNGQAIAICGGETA
ncbi:SDR family oxidoreductase [Pelomonas sp. V22]|uniref:SDR family NAD(P)-dependent oxidoreductase n=1 Tax=Pelomonas sp. V22 TaxID=2822139 RepID=UPI0024A7FB83|nr:SDR family oxidoreductase [Pelomonas sp. V22]MDI4633680.1 SDR family oxidoreductase [Pelomonas sp. V22]